MSMSGEANTIEPHAIDGLLAELRIELAQRFHGQHGADAVGDDVDVADHRVRDQSVEHLLQRDRATTSRFRGRSRSRAGSPATATRTPWCRREPDAVGQPRRVEHRGLERLVEAVDIEQYVVAAGRRPGWIADLPAGSILSICQSTSPTEASENRPSSGGTSLTRAMVIGRRTLRPVPRLGAARHRPACAWSRPAESD